MRAFGFCADDSYGKAMNWSERLNVLTGVAKAVHFLHTGVIPGFFSNRLKTNNVLLNQHRFAKLSDYGLSIVSEATRHNTVKLVTLIICICFTVIKVLKQKHGPIATMCVVQ